VGAEIAGDEPMRFNARAPTSGEVASGAIELASSPSHPDALRLLPETYVRQHSVIPLTLQDGVLVVACKEPEDTRMLNEIEVLTRHRVIAVKSTEAEILAAIADRYRDRQAMDSALRALTARATKDTPRAEPRPAEVGARSPIIQLVDRIIEQGLRESASDIHVEPQQTSLRVRFRIDGMLKDAMTMPPETAGPIASRIKVMANLDIVDRHRAQDGQIRIEDGERRVDIRVSTAETIWGEKIVLRLLDQGRSILGLHHLGLSQTAAAHLSELLRAPYGMIVVSGPTGSGKTTTLYAAINELDAVTQNITTIEDPVEYTFPNINQIQIRRVANLTFANGLRAILRQDPDVILVGEIRDLETAEIAVQSALTGHLVLTSLHAIDAVGVIQRFIEMGIEGYLVSSSLIGIVAQRLVRRICPFCATPYAISEAERILWNEYGRPSKTVFMRGAGCDHCSGTGYHGRVGVFEVLPLSDRLKRMVGAKAATDEIRAAAVKDGMVRLREAAIGSVDANVTTLEEVLRAVWVG
jgi:type IV pilus assembly protein PilB